MPFEGPLARYRNRPDTSKPSLEALAYLLRQEMPEGFRWEFPYLLEQDGCGTAGCAAGLACVTWWPDLWPEKGPEENSDEAIWLGVDGLIAATAPTVDQDDIDDIESALFVFEAANLHGVSDMAYVIPEMVANAIDFFCEHKRIPTPEEMAEWSKVPVVYLERVA